MFECIFVRHEFEPIACEGDDALMTSERFLLKCETRVHNLAIALSKRYGGYWQIWEVI